MKDQMQNVGLGIAIAGTSDYLPPNDPNVIKVREKYSNTHKIEAVLGIRVTLQDLDRNQSVCWGDGESYYFRLSNLT